MIDDVKLFAAAMLMTVGTMLLAVLLAGIAHRFGRRRVRPGDRRCAVCLGSGRWCGLHDQAMSDSEHPFDYETCVAAARACPGCQGTGEALWLHMD